MCSTGQEQLMGDIRFSMDASDRPVSKSGVGKKHRTFQHHEPHEA